MEWNHEHATNSTKGTNKKINTTYVKKSEMTQLSNVVSNNNRQRNKASRKQSVERRENVSLSAEKSIEAKQRGGETCDNQINRRIKCKKKKKRQQQKKTHART